MWNEYLNIIGYKTTNNVFEEYAENTMGIKTKNPACGGAFC